MQKCIEVEGNRRLVFVSMDVNKYLYAHQNTLYIIDINLELNTTECAVQRTERKVKYFVNKTAMCVDH